MTARQRTTEGQDASLVEYDGASFWLEHSNGDRRLAVENADAPVLDQFRGEVTDGRLRGPMDAANAAALRRVLPWLAPRTWGLATTAGTGDRLGLCTPGHARAVGEVGGIGPVFAQQSIREMGRTERGPRQVLDDATWGAFQAGWTGGVGADADHLKTVEDIDVCAEAGFVLFTLDPGDLVDPSAARARPDEARAKAAAIDWTALDSSLEDAVSRYAGRQIDLETMSVTLDEESVTRAFAKYGSAVGQARAMAEHVAAKADSYELEIAVDETDYPTTPAEHVVIVSELHRLGVEFVSFAPRFVGEFEKGIEFIGDLDALRSDFAVHAQLCRALGPYKLSLHSGSDKFSIYEPIADATHGLVHLKTAGTSWVESLRVVAQYDPDLFGDILRVCRESFETNRASYRLSCDPAKIPADPRRDELDDLITANDSRQVLHVGFGPALNTYGDRIRNVLRQHDEELTDIVSRHFVRHLAPFARHAAN